MSRLYEMGLSIMNLNPANIGGVEDAICEEWPFGNVTIPSTPPKNSLSAYGQGNLGGGESEEQFAHRLATAIFKANGGPCTIELDATYMENLPCTRFTYGEEQYKQMEEKGEMVIEDGEYFS